MIRPLNKFTFGELITFSRDEDKKSLATDCHRDNFSLKSDEWDALNLPAKNFPIMLTILIPIQDTNENNGLTQILPDSQNIPYNKIFEKKYRSSFKIFYI